MKRMCSAALLALGVMAASISPAQGQTAHETLGQYVADLQKTPNDFALREKIIKHVQTMKRAPTIPREAERFEGRAEFAIKNAKNESDFLDAAKEYEKALLIAPWIPAYYFNQGIAYEKAGRMGKAKQSFDLYLLAAPDATDAREIRKRVAGLEYAIEKGNEKAVTGKKAAVDERKKGLRDLVGNWSIKEPYDHNRYPDANSVHYRAEMRGEELFIINVVDVTFWRGYKGEESVSFIADRLEGNRLIVRAPSDPAGTYEITVSPDFNEWELYYATQYSIYRQAYTRR